MPPTEGGSLMSKMFDKERMASRSIQSVREHQPPSPPAPTPESEQEAKLHIRLLEATDANINQLNSRLERFREDLNQLSQTMDARKAASHASMPAPLPLPVQDSSSSGWYGRIVVFAIGLGIGAVVMMNNSTNPTPADRMAGNPHALSHEAGKAALAVQDGADQWDKISRPVRPAMASAKPLPTTGAAAAGDLRPVGMPSGTVADILRGTDTLDVPSATGTDPSGLVDDPSQLDGERNEIRAKQMEAMLKEAKETQLKDNQAKVEATELLDAVPVEQPKAKEDQVMTSESALPQVEPNAVVAPVTAIEPVAPTVSPSVSTSADASTAESGSGRVWSSTSPWSSQATKATQKTSIVNRYIRPRTLPSPYIPPQAVSATTAPAVSDVKPAARTSDPGFKTVTSSDGQFRF
jgi:hypothetical protein